MVLAFDDDLVWEPAEDWRALAACNGVDTDVFFPAGEDPGQVAQARAICESCPVVEECLQYALSTNQTEGVWGGMTATERRRLRRRLREQQKKAS